MAHSRSSVEKRVLRDVRRMAHQMFAELHQDPPDDYTTTLKSVIHKIRAQMRKELPPQQRGRLKNVVDDVAQARIKNGRYLSTKLDQQQS